MQSVPVNVRHKRSESNAIVARHSSIPTNISDTQRWSEGILFVAPGDALCASLQKGNKIQMASASKISPDRFENMPPIVLCARKAVRTGHKCTISYRDLGFRHRSPPSFIEKFLLGN